MRMGASLSSDSILSGLVTMYGETYPLSNSMPSTKSLSMPMDCDSSTVTTPSLPTFSTMSAIVLPSSSLSADMEAIWRISCLPLTGFAIFFSAATASAAAASMPRRTIMAFAPIEVRLSPSWMMACVSTTAVVVPSPALSLVLLATSFTMEAPMFSNLSASDISFAMVTPSFVIVGPPHDLSSATLRPFGPSVTFTVFATISTPLLSALRTSASNITCFAIESGCRD